MTFSRKDPTFLLLNASPSILINYSTLLLIMNVCMWRWLKLFQCEAQTVTRCIAMDRIPAQQYHLKYFNAFVKILPCLGGFFTEEPSKTKITFFIGDQEIAGESVRIGGVTGWI